MFELSVVHQSCKDCVFAVYDGKTQTGCSFNNRLERFRQTGENAVVDACDEEKEFCIINGRKCSAYRDINSSWAEKVPQYRERRVREELTLKVDVLIPLDGPFEERDLLATLHSLRQQLLVPVNIWCVTNHDTAKPSQVHRLLNRSQGLKWSLTNIFERGSDGSRISREALIDHMVEKFTGHFYTVYPPGSRMPKDFLLKLDEAVTDNLARFCVVLPDTQGAGLTVSRSFHASPHVNGNKPVPCEPLEEGDNPGMLHNLAEKAQYIARAHNLSWLVATQEEVVGY